MIEDDIPSSFWKENVSKTHGKHNLPSDIWERICKFRNRPIRLVQDIVLGKHSGIHTTIPCNSKGFAVDFPEVFLGLTDGEKEQILSYADSEIVPCVILGYDGILFLHHRDFKIVEPFFYMGLADLAAEASKVYA